jgi:serine/threonine protein kinase
LNDANRITKVIVGIALAMRFVHSRGVIHRDLKPNNILLDWDWKVRIADFGHSTSPENPIHRNSICGWPSINSHYLAPECYDNRYLPASDVFSFGLILYELLTGQSAFEEDLTEHGIAVRVMNDERPALPESVLPSAAELITDCWVKDPDSRPSFDEIVDRLAEMKFKLIGKVNSSKLIAFVKSIDEFEERNSVSTN